MQIPAAAARRLEIPGARELERGTVRGPKIGGAAQKPWHVARNRVERCAGRIAARDPLWIRGKYRQGPLPPLQNLPPLPLLRLLREGGTRYSITAHHFKPPNLHPGAPSAHPPRARL